VQPALLLAKATLAETVSAGVNDTVPVTVPPPLTLAEDKTSDMVDGDGRMDNVAETV
jgi:hypothetical protein